MSENVWNFHGSAGYLPKRTQPNTGLGFSSEATAAVIALSDSYHSQEY
jgi:hypothetical protein